jgi:hypothetical protein
VQGGILPAYCSLRKTAGALGKNPSKPNSRGSREQDHNLKQLEMHNSQPRMEPQENHSISKANSTTKDVNSCIGDRHQIINSKKI